MYRKIFIIFLVLFILSIITISCSNEKTLVTTLSLEESIKEIIVSNGNNYDFLSDELYISHMNQLGKELVTNTEASPLPFALGNLDDDNIPEIVVFKERDPNNMLDEGSLDLYKFNGDKYELIDSVSMNFDNTNYQIEIGKISEDQSGILLNNQVGAHSGITYGFILEENILKSILDGRKTPLISIYPDNKIKDIDDDGILEFSIFTIDPETVESSAVASDKMTLWYRWNGKDSAELLRVERKDYSNDPSNKKLYEEANRLISMEFNESLEFIIENKDKLSNYDNTELLMEYIEKLNDLSYNKGIEIQDLFVKYQEDKNYDFIFKKYDLTMEKLNSLEYLKREKVLRDEEELKQHLIKHINLGYKLYTSEGMYYYIVNNQKFVDNFSGNITNEYTDYLRILALDTNEPFMNDGALTISNERLAERILLLESFKMIYPYSNELDKVNEKYELYLSVFLYGDLHKPNYDRKTLKMSDEAMMTIEQTIERYPYTNFADFLRDFEKWIKENNLIINDEIREKFSDKLH